MRTELESSLKSKTLKQLFNGSRVSFAIVSFFGCSARAIVDHVVLSGYLGDNYKIKSEIETPGWLLNVFKGSYEKSVDFVLVSLLSTSTISAHQ